ncbi:ATP-grasp domain-containing protein [Lysinibacillus yapensis]|uniref:ATP-grasp domain-containing protein n=1 Tax=Ureibacillus yapensis TaxID=2304605 RepID=A0A396S599_9BACL|nr:ATP-grasp domain-containing protein [Lysinibacillus yapensis]RHW34665.1 ATP-grasp domain-containing protein [Lysinibacillus yapensis]
MSINILLTGGRAPATYYFARLLKEQGHTLFMAESLPKHLCMRSNLFEKNFHVPAPNENRHAFIQDLIDIIRSNNIDLLIPTCEEIFHISFGYEQLSNYCRVFCEPLEKINAFHHKGLFIETLKKVSSEWIRIPSTIVVDTTKTSSKTELSHILEKSRISLKMEYVCKPAYSRFGTEVVYKKGGEMIDFLLLNKNLWVVQEKIEGRQLCTYAIADNGQMNYYSAYPSNDQVGLGATIYFEPFSNRRLEEFVACYIKEFNYTGQIAFDVIMTDKGEFYPIECNPRTTSGICLFPVKKHAKTSDSYSIGSETTMLGLVMLQTLLSKNPFRQLRKMKKARDIVWNPKDKKVFFDQIASFFYLLKEAKKHNLSTYHMSTLDIEWNGRKDDQQ